MAHADHSHHAGLIVDAVQHTPRAHSNAPRGRAETMQRTTPRWPRIVQQGVNRLGDTRQHITAEAPEVMPGA